MKITRDDIVGFQWQSQFNLACRNRADFYTSKLADLPEDPCERLSCEVFQDSLSRHDGIKYYGLRRNVTWLNAQGVAGACKEG